MKRHLFRGVAQLGKRIDCKVLATSGNSHLRAQADEPINRQAYQEINQAAPIQQKSLVSQRLRQVRYEGKIINRITQQDGGKIFDPSPQWSTEKIARHELQNDFLLPRKSVT